MHTKSDVPYYLDRPLLLHGVPVVASILYSIAMPMSLAIVIYIIAQYYYPFLSFILSIIFLFIGIIAGAIYVRFSYKENENFFEQQKHTLVLIFNADIMNIKRLI